MCERFSSVIKKMAFTTSPPVLLKLEKELQRPREEGTRGQNVRRRVEKVNAR